LQTLVILRGLSGPDPARLADPCRMRKPMRTLAIRHGKLRIHDRMQRIFAGLKKLSK
jgi:hypothetical protein